MDIKNLLLSLTKTHSAAHILGSLNEAEKFLNGFSEVFVKDQYLIAEIGKEYNKALMLEAHIDQVCFIVTKVYDDGFLSVSPVGSIDARLLPATEVKIYGKKTIKGVFTSVPPHIKKDDSPPEIDTLFVDTGICNPKELICAGDLAFFDTIPTELKNNCFTASGLDDKAGATAVIMAFYEIAKKKIPLHTILVLCFGEELGLRGATVASFATKCDCAIAVDVSFGECEGVAAHKTAKLGSGTMVGISPILNRDIYKTLQRLAKENNIPFTNEVMGGKTGTDADIISVSKGGIPTGLLSIPLKNMHSPVEVVNIDDINSTSRLLVEFAKEVSDNA